ncbi:Hypothetical predicted protein [Pelobates cultripes]|uniref:Uncharacterized protein n=1 Tax=Pelobates cultripes TaxID=61616 RepID=A0AAD1W235_PELCU|nr:Hypothetical predicted protein [Pelobates cultripes]
MNPKKWEANALNTFKVLKTSFAGAGPDRHADRSHAGQAPVKPKFAALVLDMSPQDTHTVVEEAVDPEIGSFGSPEGSTKLRELGLFERLADPGPTRGKLKMSGE